MGKNKLRKFLEINTFSNVFQLDQGKPLKGGWAKTYFKNNNPIVLELACGKGEYTVNLGRMFPEKNFIGLDIKGNRLWHGAKTALENDMKNVAFLRIAIEDIAHFFGENEVSEIWITFADPQPQISRVRKRLTHPEFLAKYKTFLKQRAKINLKTDNDSLYAFTKEVISKLNLEIHKDTNHLYQSDLVDEILAIKTHYEKFYLKNDKNINYIQFSLS